MDTHTLSELVIKAKNGDVNAFGILYEQYFSPVYRYVYMRVRSVDEAQDIAQTVFTKAFQNITHFEDKGFSFASYLFAAARHALIDLYRKTPVSSWEDEQLNAEQSHEDVHQDAEMRDMFEQVRAAMKKLPEDQHFVLTLRLMEERSYEEIAASMRKTPETVRQIFSRGMKKLRELL